MKIAAIQMVSSPDLARNLGRARHWLEQARAQGAALAALPEYFCLMGRADTDKLAIAEAPAAARSSRCWPTPPANWACGSSAARCRCAATFPARSATVAASSRPMARRLRVMTRSICSATTTAASTTTRAGARGGRRAGAGAGRRRPRGPERPATTCAFPSCTGRAGLASCSASRRPSPTRPARRTGSCCCARAPSRTRPM